MNNFGVIELASARTTKVPGWAYVPDTGINSSTAALQPKDRKRARTQPNLSLSDLTARQEAKIRKELEVLDRDSHKDANIPLPPKAGRSVAKCTPNVRRILGSQKTFANYLDDYEALMALADSNPSQAPSRVAASSSAAVTNKRAAASTGKRPDAYKVTAPRHKREKEKEEDTEMTDALPPVLPPYAKAPPASDAADDNPLLVSRVPPMPTDEELRKLLAAPPLTYHEARGDWGDDEARYPTRHFCTVCGYWGRVKCMKCGTRVCALDCLETHREECFTRYGL